VQEAGMRQQALAGHMQSLAALLQKLSRTEAEERLEPGAAAALRQVEAALEPARLASLPLAFPAPSADAALSERLREQLIRASTALDTLLRERLPSPVRENAETLHEALQPVLNEVERLRELAPLLSRAGASAREIANATDALAHDAAALVRSYPPSSFAVSRWMWAGIAAGVAAFGCLLWILKAMLADAERRAASSLQSAVRNRQANQRTQEAILRLLDQLSRLAHGDLTVRADVADELTGAVADAINYAVGELRRLVLGIHSAADRLAEACAEAQELSGELLNASERQAQEISETAASLAAVSRSASEISERAAASAKAAETSLQAAQQGSASVRRSVAGIEGIRQQVQETAKRIKRLGESSQEIGESVDLIGEISERSHVLALNAAIQASASNVGRGFGLVADEVRSLAERSAHAARQIDAVVKAIQLETQDATSAMERSTARVVEQTQVARSAGQALKRIDEHAHDLALLTDAISTATQAQSETARCIDAAMAEVAGVSELAAEATRKSADRSAQLAALARELKQLVAGFKAS
jgi:twitching motility protein PilJ